MMRKEKRVADQPFFQVIVQLNLYAKLRGKLLQASFRGAGSCVHQEQEGSDDAC